MNRVLIYTLIVSLIISFVAPTYVYALTESDQGSITILIVNQNTKKPIPNMSLYINGKKVGTTNEKGIVFIENISIGEHTVELRRPNEVLGTNYGLKVRKKNDFTEFWYDGDSTLNERVKVEKNWDGFVEGLKRLKIAEDYKRKTKINVYFDETIPDNIQLYINKLVMDIDPYVRRILGEPLRDGYLKLRYIHGDHVTLNDDKTVMTFGKLPNISEGNDKAWDEIFLVNYIHKFLQGGSIPVPGIRYTENLAHSIKELVAEYMHVEGKREIAFKGMDYYINACSSFKPLKPEIVLNQGNTYVINTSFNRYNFLLENETYRKLNAFTIEYAKSVWLSAAYARYLETGLLDFFYVLKENLYQKKPQTKIEFENIMKDLIKKINGKETIKWMENQSLFKGSIQEKINLSLFITKGNFFNVLGRNNPDYIYPLVISRTPGKIEEVDTNIIIKDERGNIILNEVVRSGINDGGVEGLKLDTEKFKPGKYTVIGKCYYNGKEILDTQEFYVYDSISTDDYWVNINEVPNIRNTKVEVKYDSSIPKETAVYIEELISIIDPVIRKIAGEPQENRELLIKHDPEGLASMNSDMSILNIKRLPRNNILDTAFDSFFFIEYYHMFHKGTQVPIKNVRYNENISQAMKIVISHYLKQYKIRETSVKSIPYYINLHGVLEHLGPGILVNLGITNGNSGDNYDIRAKWDHNSKFLMGMNVFTLEYGPTTWLILADAYNRRHGEYGFFRELQNELSKNSPITREEFYDLIDILVDSRIDGKMPSEWLKETSLYRELPEEDYFVKPLPVREIDRFIYGIDNPNYILPFAVSRKGAAKIIETEYTVSIIDSLGNKVFSQKYVPELNDYNGFIKPLKIPKLKAGEYKAVLNLKYDGKELSGEQDFKILTE